MNFAVKEVPYYDERGFDTYVAVEDHRVFGVFDGMGVSEGARGASGLAAAKFMKVASTSPDGVALGAHIDDVSKSIAVHFPSDGTTATVVRIDSDNNLHYAHIGDSRLYILHDGRLKQVTADEGIENRLTNYCGPYTHGCVQVGFIVANDWSRLMLCTDGITGDFRHQEIGDDMIEMIMSDYNVSAVAEKLYQKSLKNDDKTVIVVEK